MTDERGLAEAFAAAYPELAEVAAAAPDPVYLVGGAVRDLLLRGGRSDIDLAVEGDPRDLAAALGAETLAEHSRFGTLKVGWRDETLDLAATRRERYVRPGVLPAVEVGAPIRTDLARRDFTVNAMAIPLADPHELLDPYDGQVDLRAGVLRAIHDDSFADDPTRAIRAARYAARFGFGIEEGTRGLLLATDLGTVSPERRAEELRRLAREADATRGIELLAGWGLVALRPGGESLALARDVNRLMAAPPWSEEADRAEAILAAALGPGFHDGASPDAKLADGGRAGDGGRGAGGASPGEESATAQPAWAAIRPARPSEGVARARGRDPIELVLARAAGAEWLDDWLDWREVALEISGSDLTAAGHSGPAIGEALEAALVAKLDGEAPTRADELRVALDLLGS